MVKYAAMVEKMLAQPRKPGRKSYMNHTKTELRQGARKKGLYYHGSTKDLTARLQAWWEPQYRERMITWEL